MLLGEAANEFGAPVSVGGVGVAPLRGGGAALNQNVGVREIRNAIGKPIGLAYREMIAIGKVISIGKMIAIGK